MEQKSETQPDQQTIDEVLNLFNNKFLSFGCPIIPTQFVELAENTDLSVQ